MQLRNKALTLLFLTTFAPMAVANNKHCCSPYFRAPYVGAEIIQTNQNYKYGFGKDVFVKNPQEYNFFAGFRFSDYFGLEGGYEFQPRRSKNVTLVAGQVPPGGDVIEQGSSFSLTSQIKGYHPYLGVFAELDQCAPRIGKIKYQALVAAAFSTITALDSVYAVDGTPLTPRVATYHKYRTGVLVKLAAGHTFRNHIGARVSVQYRNDSIFQIHSEQPGTAEIKLKDTWGVGLGLTYSFFD
ncbi:MAG TPA: outer membrane beta-barrel protein [Gammaproteobacteria bacterium]|nr:outer membrane beta-barrel protein [Gammaproteobacteria bacterium]